MVRVSTPCSAQETGFFDRQMAAFQDSDIVFERSSSNIPFAPLAYLSTSHYGSAKVESRTRGTAIEYDLSTVSHAAGLPLLLGKRDALVIGEYLSWSRFDLHKSHLEDFDVGTIGMPVAWFRQVNPRWQAAAFVFPMAHQSSQEDADWTWQTMGGAFGRYVHNDRLWWAFGFYADVAPGDNFYIPYLGASWQLNPRWTISAIMPWPAILYAPNTDWMFRAGVSPSGASWSFVPQGSDNVALNFDAWDLGASVERRLTGMWHLGLEAGVGGFRGLRLQGSDFEDAEFSVHSSAFVKMSLNFRPAVE